MTGQQAIGFAACLFLGCTLAGCGDAIPDLAPHGLETETLSSGPTGEVVETYTDLTPGIWRGTVRKTWSETRDGGSARRGRAVFGLEVERTRDDAGFVTRLKVAVVEAEGLAKRHGQPFDGLETTIRHGPTGAPDPRTLRVDATAAGGQSFLRGFWLAGLAGATPWFPTGALKEGESWPRSRLGEKAWIAAIPGPAKALPRFRGGARLEEVLSDGGETLLRVRLDGLIEEERARPGEAVNWGQRDRGEAVIRARDGIPRMWRLTQDYRVRHQAGDRHSELDIRMEVEGDLAPRSPDDR